MNTKKIKSLQVRIERIKKALAQLGDMRPGSLSRQYNVCGNPTCRCKDPKKPKKHGPYYQVSFSRRGKSSSTFVKREEVAEVKRQLQNYQRFKILTEEWVELSMQVVKLKREKTRPT